MATYYFVCLLILIKNNLTIYQQLVFFTKSFRLAQNLIWIFQKVFSLLKLFYQLNIKLFKWIYNF